MPEGLIAENYRRIRGELPEHVELVVAAKGRTAGDIAQVIEAGARIIGENYVQDAEAAVAALGELARRAEWHMIGHLQTNKVKKALSIFDVLQSLDSARVAEVVDAKADPRARVYVEVNIGGEESKSGVPMHQVEQLLHELSGLKNLRVEGLMTIEPYCEDPARARTYFRRMKELFEELRTLRMPNVELKVLSMGMSHSYNVAVEEGANMVRIGTAIFGPRAG
jgi:hypothetical protein